MGLIPMLSPKQEKAAVMVGRGQEPKVICEALDMNRKTLYLWKKNPEFLAAASAAQASLGEPSAVNVLRTLLTSDREDIRLRAAVALLQRPPEEAEPTTALPPGAVLTFPDDEHEPELVEV